MKRYRIQLKGKVHGVAFRYYSKLKANELGLFGTTENQADGSVITIISGKVEIIEKFIEWCYQGSPASKVDEVKVTELSASESQEYKDFSILR